MFSGTPRLRTAYRDLEWAAILKVELEVGWHDLKIPRWVSSADGKIVVPPTSMEVEAGMGLCLEFLVGLVLVMRSLVLE